MLSDGGPVTVREIQLNKTGWPGRSPEAQEPDRLGRMSTSTMLVENE